MSNYKWTIRVHTIGGANVSFRTWVEKMFKEVPSAAALVVVDFEAVQFISR